MNYPFQTIETVSKPIILFFINYSTVIPYQNRFNLAKIQCRKLKIL